MNNSRKLYLSHLLTSWVDRSFEFASYLMISNVYTSLLQSSIYGLTITLVALLFSNRIGNWINILSRLNTYRITLLTQKLSIILSTVLFYYLDSSDGVHNVYYAFIILLGCTLRLAFIGNSIAIEKDWAMIISDGHLELLLPTMRRIDLVCKTLSPILIGYLLLAPPLVVTITISVWTSVSTMMEYILISQIHRDVPALGSRAPFSSEAPTAGGGEEEVAAVPVSVREYVGHRTFLATLSLGILYVNVLSFGGTMTSYLALVGYDSGLLGIMKALSGIMGVAGTFVMPLLSARIGNVRTGLWSIWQLVFMLVLVILALTNKLDHTATSVLLFGGMALSRLGLWVFDIAGSLILQEYTASTHITGIAGWQYSVCNLFELLGSSDNEALDAGLSTGMRGGLALAAVATSGSSTALVQWCLGPYVRKITIPNNTLSAVDTSSTNPSQPESTNAAITVTRSTPVSFETLSFLGGKRITTVKVSDLEPSSAPFSTIRIRAGQQSVVRDGRGRILSDGNKLKKRLYLHRELTSEEPLRTIMAEIQQNQNLTPSTNAPAKLSKVSETAKDGSDSAHAGVKAPVTEGMSDRIEQLKRKASENAKKDH
ncbi:hypothetical protein BGZ79_002072 [Entomortierella chlamydospora]|nr:hypothetical protein BGZ79_002072 [Entomortierella chlamydospora]